MTPFDLAQRFIGELKELPGEHADHPLIQWWLSLCGFGFDAHDEVPWCSAFINGICWELRLPRSKSAAARSWLQVGEAVTLATARVGYDLVVLSRGTNPAQGHVGFYAGVEWIEPPDQLSPKQYVRLISGNMSNQVTMGEFEVSRVVGVRRLRPASVVG